MLANQSGTYQTCGINSCSTSHVITDIIRPEMSNCVFSWSSLSNEIENMGCVTAYAVSNSYLRRELQLLRIVLFSHSYRLQALSSVTFWTCSCLSALPWHVMQATCFCQCFSSSRVSFVLCVLRSVRLWQPAVVLSFVPCLLCVHSAPLCGRCLCFHIYPVAAHSFSCILHVPSCNVFNWSFTSRSLRCNILSCQEKLHWLQVYIYHFNFCHLKWGDTKKLAPGFSCYSGFFLACSFLLT